MILSIPEGTIFIQEGHGAIRQLSITSGTNISANALHTFNIGSSNGKYEFDVNGTTERHWIVQTLLLQVMY